MQLLHINPDVIAQKAMEIMGGRDKFFEASDKELKEINDKWSQNIDAIGRILRAHLFVEHFLTSYLAKANPRLGSMAEARLTFAQKIGLLDATNLDVSQILPGLKRLNSIRNRLAHNLNVHVTEEDAKIFLGCERFAAMRSARAGFQLIGKMPLEVLEDFARFTSTVFTYEFSPIGQAIAAAINEIRAGESRA